MNKTVFNSYLRQARGILHIGAHKGQEAHSYHTLNKPVLWVEAMPKIFSLLLDNIRPYPEQKAICALLGNRDNEECEFYISNNNEGVSSSIYMFGVYGEGEQSLWPQLDLHMIDSISLKMCRLDTLVPIHNIDMSLYDVWILDVQGAEKIVLEGAGGVLKYANAILCEVSTVPVYEDGVLWEELKEYFVQYGFSPLWMPGKEHDDILFIRSVDHENF